MPDPGTPTAADEPRSPWLRTGFVLAAAFVGFVAVIAGAVVFTSDASGQDDGSAASRPPSTGPPPTRRPHPAVTAPAPNWPTPARTYPPPPPRA